MINLHLWPEGFRSATSPDKRGCMRHLSAIAVLPILLNAFLLAPCHGENMRSSAQTVSGWQFRLAASTPDPAPHPDAEQWHAATVPSTVQTDLLRNGLIVDPFTDAHEAQLQWIGL